MKLSYIRTCSFNFSKFLQTWTIRWNNFINEELFVARWILTIGLCVVDCIIVTFLNDVMGIGLARSGNYFREYRRWRFCWQCRNEGQMSNVLGFEDQPIGPLHADRTGLKICTWSLDLDWLNGKFLYWAGYAGFLFKLLVIGWIIFAMGLGFSGVSVSKRFLFLTGWVDLLNFALCYCFLALHLPF